MSDSLEAPWTAAGMPHSVLTISTVCSSSCPGNITWHCPNCWWGCFNSLHSPLGIFLWELVSNELNLDGECLCIWGWKIGLKKGSWDPLDFTIKQDVDTADAVWRLAWTPGYTESQILILSWWSAWQTLTGISRRWWFIRWSWVGFRNSYGGKTVFILVSDWNMQRINYACFHCLASIVMIFLMMIMASHYGRSIFPVTLHWRCSLSHFKCEEMETEWWGKLSSVT